MNVSLFLEKLVFVLVYFQISRRHVPTKTSHEYHTGPISKFSEMDNSLALLTAADQKAGN